MSGHLWDTNKDGTIEYRSLTKEYLESALKIMSEAFFIDENVCKAIGLKDNPASIEELCELATKAALDGVCVIAIDKKTNNVAGAAFNKLQTKVPSAADDSYFETFAKNCKHKQSKAVVDFMIESDALFDFFGELRVDCLLEIMFLGTLPAYRGNGIARKLCEVSIQAAKALRNGVNVKQPVDGAGLRLEPVPRVVTAIYTSFITQRIGRELGFKIAAARDYAEFEFEGRRYSDVVKDTKGFTLEYLMV